MMMHLAGFFLALGYQFRTLDTLHRTKFILFLANHFGLAVALGTVFGISATAMALGAKIVLWWEILGLKGLEFQNPEM
jgi:hypothetical protein